MFEREEKLYIIKVIFYKGDNIVMKSSDSFTFTIIHENPQTGKMILPSGAIVNKTLNYSCLDKLNLDQNNKDSSELNWFIIIVYKNKKEIKGPENNTMKLFNKDFKDKTNFKDESNISKHSIRFILETKPDEENYDNYNDNNSSKDSDEGMDKQFNVKHLQLARGGNGLFYVNIIIIIALLFLMLICFIRGICLLCCKKRPRRETHIQAENHRNDISMQSENMNFQYKNKNVEFNALNNTMGLR